jgi:AcrR family transcriptional regulator
MSQSTKASSRKKEAILSAAISVFGRFGYRKTSVDDLAEAAKISKQGLYLHFASKRDVFLAAMQKYLDDGLGSVQKELNQPGKTLFERLMGAMDVWFGRHFVTFTQESLDVIETGDELAGNEIEQYKDALKAKIAKAIADSREFNERKNICSPKEISQVLFLCGLTWKEGHASRAEFMKKINLCIRACCQIEK